MRLRWSSLALILVVIGVGFSSAACGGGGSDGDGDGDPPAPEVPLDVLALHDQDLTAATPSCQSMDCHESQMTRFAPHKDATGNDVETFHYVKAKSLASVFFGGRTPDALTDQDCTVCHKRVKLLVQSGANAAGTETHLRRMVDVSFCAGCHGPGSSKPLFLK